MPDNDPTQDPTAWPPGTVPPEPAAAAPTTGDAPGTAYPATSAGYQPAPGYYPPQAAPQYVPVQTAVPAQQVMMAPAAAAPAAAVPRNPTPGEEGKTRTEDAVDKDAEDVQPEIVIVAHSGLFYWWPVWVVGYLFALVTWWHGQSVTVGDTAVRIHESNNIGILYFTTIFLVILISNVEVRGVASLAVVLTLVLGVVLLAYFRVWDAVLHWFGHLNIYINQGAYFWFSTLMFLTWALATFVFDRFTHWVIKPGQITREHFWGAGSQSYATENMTLEKRRNDLFRHWILGLGSGDLRVHTYGAQHEEIFIPNVLFVGYKIHAVERLIAERPAEFGRPTIK